MKISFKTVAGFLAMAAAVQLPAADNLEPQALRIIKEFSETLKQAKTIQVTISTKAHVLLPGVDQQMDNVSAAEIVKPDKIAVRILRGSTGVEVVSDGKTINTYVPSQQKYSSTPSADGLQEATMLSATLTGGFDLLGLLCGDSPYDVLMDGVEKAAFLGEENVGGAKLAHIRMEQQDMDWDAWFDLSKQATLRQLRPDMSKTLKRLAAQSPDPAAFLKQVKYETLISFEGWVFDKPIPDKAFVFTPPAGATKVASLIPQPEQEAEDAPSPLQGKLAPAFTIDTLDGKKFDLAAQRGKNVVVLDFWATWCGPCRMALPVVSATAESLKAKGVVFLAVNQGESKEAVEQFLKEQKLQCPVGFDTEGAVAAKYLVSGIPQTVIIGKDGLVKKVHVGFSPSMKEDLTKDIEAALGN